METTGFFVLYEGLPHLVLDGFPKDLLEAKKIPVASEGEIATDFVSPAVKGSWSIETADGPLIRDGYLFSLEGHLGANGRKEARILCECLQHESLSRGLHRIRFNSDGSLAGWGRTSAS